jgi:hypothetical protein
MKLIDYAPLRFAAGFRRRYGFGGMGWRWAAPLRMCSYQLNGTKAIYQQTHELVEFRVHARLHCAQSIARSSRQYFSCAFSWPMRSTLPRIVMIARLMIDHGGLNEELPVCGDVATLDRVSFLL